MKKNGEKIPKKRGLEKKHALQDEIFTFGYKADTNKTDCPW